MLQKVTTEINKQTASTTFEQSEHGKSFSWIKQKLMRNKICNIIRSKRKRNIVDRILIKELVMKELVYYRLCSPDQWEEELSTSGTTWTYVQ